MTAINPFNKNHRKITGSEKPDKNITVHHGGKSHPHGTPCKFCKKVKEEFEKSEFMTKSKIEQEFFDKLAEVLEKHFPKGECQERSPALVLNAMANVFLNKAIAKAKAEERERIGEEFKKWGDEEADENVSTVDNFRNAIQRITGVKLSE